MGIENNVRSGHTTPRAAPSPKEEAQKSPESSDGKSASKFGFQSPYGSFARAPSSAEATPAKSVATSPERSGGESGSRLGFDSPEKSTPPPSRKIRAATFHSKNRVW